MTKKALQWHPAFQAALQIEFMDEPCQLEFLKEFNLTEKPLQIDTLVIKPEPDKILFKSIGHIFRKYNIIELLSIRTRKIISASTIITG